MRNLEDEKTKIYPSTTRGGKELPSSSALDSPSVLSKLATPKPASAIRSDMSHVIDDACRCQSRRISGRGPRTVRLRLMVTGGGGQDVYPGSGPLDGGKTLRPA